MRILWSKTNNHNKSFPMKRTASHAPVVLSPDNISGTNDIQTGTITC
jgi:hypothetical protein